MLRVANVTASYSLLLPEMLQLHVMYTIRIGWLSYSGAEQTNSAKAGVCHVLASDHH